MEGDLKRVTFARTPIMSTYLLAFVVGEFDYVEERDTNGVLVRVYTPVGKAEQGRFALEVSFKSLVSHQNSQACSDSHKFMQVLLSFYFSLACCEDFAILRGLV